MATGSLFEKLQAEFLGFSLYRGAPGKIRNENSAFVANQAGVNVLVGLRVFFDRADVNASFVGKGASAYKWLIAVRTGCLPAPG